MTRSEALAEALAAARELVKTPADHEARRKLERRAIELCRRCKHKSAELRALVAVIVDFAGGEGDVGQLRAALFAYDRARAEAAA